MPWWPSGQRGAAQAEPRVRIHRDVQAKRFPVRNSGPLSHGSRAINPAALPSFSQGFWWLWAGHGTATECWRHLPARVPCGAAGEAALLPLPSPSGSEVALGSPELFHKPGLAAGLCDEERGRSSCPGAPACSQCCHLPCPSFPALPSLPLPAGISKSFLPTQRGCFSFSALPPCLETVAWRQSPSSSRF